MSIGKLFRILAILIVGLVAIFLFVTNFSVTETILNCKGEITDARQSRPSILYASLNEYRWWVGLWNDRSDGDLTIELPEMRYFYFDTLKENLNTLLHIFNRDFKGDPDKLEFMGSYSRLSKSLKLDTPFGFFDGTCTAAT